MCFSVGELLSLTGVAKLLNKQESWLCSPGEMGRQRHPMLSAPLQQCPGRAGGKRCTRRRERKRPILALPAPGWQTSLLAARPLGAASDWISQPGKCSKKGKGVKTKIDKTRQVAARKPRAGSRPEAKAGWARRRLRRGDSRDGAVTLRGSSSHQRWCHWGFGEGNSPPSLLLGKAHSGGGEGRRDDFSRKTRQASTAFASVKFWVLKPVFNYFFLPFFFRVPIFKENV